MDKRTIDRLKGTLIVPAGLTIVLLSISFLIGWNLAALVAFWLVITPILAICLPTVVSSKQNKWSKSIAGLLTFYGLMVLLIFEHYRTDYFKVMILSALINVILVGIFLRALEKPTKA